MQIIDMIQNTPEWEALRGTRIGASDANIIMGESEYCTIRQLWEQKALGKKREEGNTFAQDKGHRLELKNRATLEIEIGFDFPPMTVLSDDYPFLMASLDGIATVTRVWDNDKNGWIEDPHYVLAEFKYCGQDDFNLVFAGECLPQYKPQIQQQLLLTGARYCILGVTTEDKEAIDTQIKKDIEAGIDVESTEYKKPKIFKYARTNILPDLVYMEKELLPALIKFNEAVINKTDPGYGPRDVKDESENVALSDTLSRYKKMLKDQEEIADLISKTEKEIFKLTTHTNVICDGVKIQQSQKAASKTTVYDYEKFLKDRELTLPEEYISIKTSATPKPTKTIKFPKEEPVKETKSAEQMIVKGAHLPQLMTHDTAILPADDPASPMHPDNMCKPGIPMDEKPKRKRRTKAEIEADKLKGEANAN